MARLLRITSVYDEREDRIRITGETEQGEVHACMVTRRLLQRLIVHLLEILDPAAAKTPATATTPAAQASAQTRSGLMQEMAQLQAGAALKAGTPVVGREEQSPWLIEAIDVSRQENRLMVVFRGQDGTQMETVLNGQELRQWLTIIHRLWRKAEWSMEIWPEWMQSDNPFAPDQNEALH